MDRPLTLTWMYTLGRLEAVSFLLLLGVAMPLKYAGGVLWATPWFGWIHGLLFLQFLVALGSARRVMGWPRVWLVWGFVAAVLPFGTFVLERAVRRRAGA
ncbi:MAG: DUF3817 domain-containing protein [Nannocystaceae bacterium]